MNVFRFLGAVLAAVSLSTGPADAWDRFSKPKKPWYMETRHACTEHINMSGGNDSLFWEREEILPPKKEKELEIKRGVAWTTTILGQAPVIYFQIPPAGMQAIAANGQDTFVADAVPMTPLLKKEVETRARLQEQGLIDTKNNLVALGFLSGTGILNLAGLPAAASYFAFSAKTYKFISIGRNAIRLNQQALTRPRIEYTDPDKLDPRRLAEFFYGDATLQRTYSIVADADNPANHWILVQINIRAANVAGAPVLIAFRTCLYPIKPTAS
jgi:hypothetical protein